MTRFAVLFVPVFVLFGCASSSDLTELEERVAALEQKLESGAKPSAAAPAVDAQAETDARKLLGEAQSLLREGKNKEAVAKLEACTKDYQKTKTGSRCSAMLDEARVVGSKIEDVPVAQWVQGTAKFSGKDTLLVFWEVWCPHCQREVPKLEAIHNEYKGKGLQVVGLTKMSRGITEEQVEGFLKDNKVTYPIAVEKDGIPSRDFAVRGVPAAAFINEKGEVVWRGHPASLNNAEIERLMKS